MLLARIKVFIGAVATAISMGGCITIPAPPGQSSACTAQPPGDANQTKHVTIQLQPSDSSKPIVRNCLTMIVTYGRNVSTQTVLLAEVLDPATHGIQFKTSLQASSISNVLFYWREGPGGNGARRAFVLNGPPDGMDWNAISLSWNVLGIGADVYEYETSGFAKLP